MPFKYTVGLEVEGQGKIESAATSVDDLDDGLKALSKEAKGLSTSMDAGASGADGLDGSLSEISAEAKAAMDAMGMSADEAKKMAREFEGADRAALTMADHYGDIDSQMMAFDNPISRSIARVYELKEAYMKLSLFAGRGTAMLALATIGITMLATAAIVAIVAIAALGAALVKAAIGASDTANEVAIMREGLTGSAAAAADLTGTINRVADGVPLGVSKVGELAEGLYEAGKRGAELEEALYEASYEAAGLGKNPGPELIARRMANLSVISTKLGDHFAEIFSGASTTAATEKFGKSLSGFVELFGQNHSQGRALKKLLGTVVDPMIDGLTKIVPLAKAAFDGVIIAALDAAIAVVKTRNAILEMIPDEAKDKASELAGDLDVLAIAASAGKFIFGMFVASLVIVAAVIGIVIGVIGAVIGVIFGLIAAFAMGVVAVGEFAADAGAELLDFASKGVDVAADMIAGLVSGIKAGVGPVVEAIKAMAGSAVNAIKSALKIASPSKIFEDMGMYTGEGYAIGIEGETGAVQSSLETMVSPPSTEMPSLASAGSSSGGSMGGGAKVDLSGASFVFHGVKDAESAVSLFEEALTRVLEGDAIAVGAG